MSAILTTRPERSSTAAPAAPLTAVGDLLRLYLRLDRVRIAVWTVALAGTVAATAASLVVAYPDAAARQARAALLENPAAVLMTGPAYGIDDYTLGAMTANELSLTVFVAVAIMSILLAVRHTRAQEEAGRLELLRALPVGAFAPAAAALALVVVANLVVAAGIAVALVSCGLEPASSVAFGVAGAVTGVLFGAVGAVTAQFGEHSRSATGIALTVLAVAFLVRGIGDVVEPTGSWLSWLSPIAWAQQTRLYVDLRWWPLVLSVAATLALLTLAVVLSRMRDLGAGLRPPKPGPSAADRTLTTPVGLAWRLLRGTFAGWLSALALLGVAMGALANSLDGLVDEMPQVAEWLGANPERLTSSFAGTMLLFLAVGAGAFGVACVLRLRTEEEAGRVGLVLVTGTSRIAWLAGSIVVILGQVSVALVVGGAATGLGVTFAVGDAEWAARMTMASLAYLPTAVLVVAVAVVLTAWLPRSAALAWLPVVWALFVAWLGEILRLPEAAMALSPYHHVPLVPAESGAVAPLLISGALAAGLYLVAVPGFRRRDVQV